jgi:hypothetical protein
MGQAWILEAISEFAFITNSKIAAECAYYFYSKFLFCYSSNTWCLVDVTTCKRTYDRVFNHNLWFCAAASLLARQDIPEVSKHVSAFVKNIKNELLIYHDSIVHHSSPTYLSRLPKDSIRIVLRTIKNRVAANTLYEKSVGYHSFNLYALALLYSNKNPLWNQHLSFIHKLYSATLTSKYRSRLKKSKYSYDYNAPGFELPYVSLILYPDSGLNPDFTYWLFSQLAYTAKIQSDSLSFISTCDSETLNARIYELSRILPFL